MKRAVGNTGNWRSRLVRLCFVATLTLLTLACGSAAQGPAIATATPTDAGTGATTPTPIPPRPPTRTSTPTPRASISAFVFGDVAAGQIFLQTKVRISCTGATLNYQGPESPSPAVAKTPTPKPLVNKASSITSQPQDTSGNFQWTFLFTWAQPPAAGKWLFNAACTAPNADVKGSGTFIAP